MAENLGKRKMKTEDEAEDEQRPLKAKKQQRRRGYLERLSEMPLDVVTEVSRSPGEEAEY